MLEEWRMEKMKIAGAPGEKKIISLDVVGGGTCICTMISGHYNCTSLRGLGREMEGDMAREGEIRKKRNYRSSRSVEFCYFTQQYFFVGSVLLNFS